MRYLLPTLTLLVAAGPVLAEKPKPVYPVTYSTPSPNEQFLFVMLAPPSGDAALDPDNTDHAKGLRKKYPASGLYRNDGGTDPLWTADWYDYTAFPADDGIHLVREHGSARLATFIGKRLPEDVAREQLDGLALSFLKQGNVLKTYTIRDLVTTPDDLPHSMTHVLWMTGGTITRDGKRFVLTTHDTHQIVFDLSTGEIVGRKKLGLGGGQIWVVRGLMAFVALFVVAAIVRWFVMARKAQG